MYIQSGSPQIRNSVIWGNTASTAPGIVDAMGTGVIAYSIVQDSSYPTSAGADGNMKTDPQFMQLVQASSGSPTTGGNYRLQSGSPAINAGDPAYTPTGAAALDPDGTARIKGGRVDMGAYER
jgi:hypothetical protein